MTGPFKRTLVGTSPELADGLGVAAPSELLREPMRSASRSQDTVLAGRRVLLSRHNGGSDEWLVDDAPTGGITQGKPEPDVWRVVLRAKTNLSAGSVLVARTVASPCGITEKLDNQGGTWEPETVGGDTRFAVTWDDGTSTETTTTIVQLPDNANDDGAETSEDGAGWREMSFHATLLIEPDGASESLAERARWSEWPTLTFEVADRGGARIVHQTLAEEPLEHVIADDELDTTCNGAVAGQPWPTAYPQEEGADNSNEEHRYGTHRIMAAAERQTERVGPRLAQWGAYDEASAEPTDVEADARTFNLTTFERISAGSNTAWSADAVGFDVLGAAPAPYHLSTRISGAASVPVRARVYARFNQAGANLGVVRLQSSPRSYVEITVEQASVGDAWGWIEATGWIESATASDDPYVVMQDFAKTTGDTLEIRYWDLGYGEY